MHKASDGSMVKVERWQWVAEYASGETIYQFDDRDKTFHSIKELDLSKVVRFGMVTGGKKMIIDVNPKEMQVFHYYLNFGEIVNDKAKLTSRVYVFGYKHRGSSNTNYFFILPNDEIVIKNNQNLQC